MNDLLGGKEAGEGNAMTHLPKPKPKCPSAPSKLSAGRHRSDRIWSEQTDRKPITVAEADKRNACNV